MLKIKTMYKLKKEFLQVFENKNFHGVYELFWWKSKGVSINCLDEVKIKVKHGTKASNEGFNSLGHYEGLEFGNFEIPLTIFGECSNKKYHHILQYGIPKILPLIQDIIDKNL
jgi:hypothetical protein